MTKISLLNWIDKKEADAPPLTKFGRYLLRILWITIGQFNNNDLSLRSGALTYTILLSLVPMLAMSTAVVKGLGGGNQLREAAYTYLDTLDKAKKFPIPHIDLEQDKSLKKSISQAENLTTHLRSAVDKLFDYVDRTNFATIGTFGVVGIFLSVILVLSHIESAMNAIWKVSSGRSILRKISDYITLLILFPLSINVAFAASAFLKNPILASKMDILIPFDWLQALLLQAIPMLFIALSFYAMYIFFTNTRVKTVPALLGATLAAFLWFGVQNVYITLQVGVAKYNAIYGSFATFPLFLIWIYLGWMFILAGAQIAFAIQNAETFQLTPTGDTPSLKLAAAFDIMDLLYQNFDSHKPTTSHSLSDNLPSYQRQLIDNVTDELTLAGVIHLSTTDNRFLPLFPRHNYNRENIIKIIFGDEIPNSAGGQQSLQAITAARQSGNSQVS